MKKLFAELQNCLLASKDCVLVSILANTGSAPRGLGAHMLVSGQGRVCGTIGGGAVEHHATQLAVEAMVQPKSFVKDYRLSADLGMICGGNVTVLYQYISANNTAMRQLCADALRLFAANADIWLITRLEQDGQWRMGIATRTELSPGLELALTELQQHLQLSPTSFTQGGADYYVEPLNSAARALIFGGGHVAQALVPVLAQLNFNCWVMDNRPEMIDERLFPGAKKALLIDYERISEYLEIRGDDFAVIMTHGHAADYVVQKQIMQERPAYIGVIGSRNKVKTLSNRLLAEGFTAADIARVHAPIGIAIKAETPEEIAISIAAELIQVRAERMGR